ncbi:MAG: hypothetical protein MI919_36300, partial [Holophagales bacterium]|nr:hypothetical protein [Holophagales bacterium]
MSRIRTHLLGCVLLLTVSTAVQLGSAPQPPTVSPGPAASEVPAADAREVALDLLGGAVVQAWITADGAVYIHDERLSSPVELRQADGTEVFDLALELILSGVAVGGTVSWTRLDEAGPVREVVGLPEIFADGFELGNTSLWT